VHQLVNKQNFDNIKMHGTNGGGGGIITFPLNTKNGGFDGMGHVPCTRKTWNAFEIETAWHHRVKFVLTLWPWKWTFK
jgi:hypothetical protein